MKTTKQYKVTTRFVLLFGTLLLLTNIILGVVMMNFSRNAVRDLVRKNMLDIATTAADLVDGDALGALTEDDVGSTKFNEILEDLSAFQQNNNIEYIYAVRKVNDDTFVFTVDADPDDPAYFGEEVLITDALRSAGKGVASVDEAPAEDEWGNFYSAYCPVYDSNGEIAGIIGVDFDSLWYESHIRDHTITIIIITSISVIAAAVIVVLFTRNVRKRIESLGSIISDLSNDVDELAEVIAISNHENLGEAYNHVSISQEDVNGDEIEALGTKIQAMHVELNKYIDYSHKMAYTDALTGVKNTTAYIEMQKDMSNKIDDNIANFFIIVFDINNLKRINDRYGHAMGDKMIRGAGSSIEKAFGENTYRIGGDEFLVLLEDIEESEVHQKMNNFDFVIDQYNKNSDENDAILSISKGLARFVPNQDNSFKEVFMRADEDMYLSKRRNSSTLL